ncbi:hypothetical protein A2625_01260 [candidate division WOR-1 bacterium RIFCSPHIGHO2_01_FULL_53_15]|uniref:DUF86 domain-containing protein n=1 Tax=candidate division WOR-1 bacterium RIFCSPHIGHO2_01_FULL_53_15 TaxID=1802564 RepID=A0A1F4Q0I5_UNCSA|nr:MAG: hypothetical protein A2625_01260 [candidate division WOR-1 bacterium RIFCSPHIGHO2_01_FULL_53_15]OGC12999.1 MAG: hypothetical protein A3D23_03965 [candidate division WOR-1 bacterium RIFCSPHIGHO2_02_FULL_53_26]
MKNDLVYLEHIAEAIQKIEKYLKEVSFEQFSGNDMLIDAVIRELEIIGEAANQISGKARDQYPSMPWSQMIGMRNRLIHEYFGVNKKIVWETCSTDLKELRKILATILPR